MSRFRLVAGDPLRLNTHSRYRVSPVLLTDPVTVSLHDVEVDWLSSLGSMSTLNELMKLKINESRQFLDRLTSFESISARRNFARKANRPAAKAVSSFQRRQLDLVRGYVSLRANAVCTFEIGRDCVDESPSQRSEWYLPFDHIEVTCSFTSGKTAWYFESNGDNSFSVASMHIESDGSSYATGARIICGSDSVILGVLLNALESKEYRYEEIPVSRQVRRRESRSVQSYRRFIVIRRGLVSVSRFTAAHTRSHVARALHAVRGHLRRYKTGKVSFVRAHVRGKIGSALQVKDYIVEAA